MHTVIAAPQRKRAPWCGGVIDFAPDAAFDPGPARHHRLRVGDSAEVRQRLPGPVPRGGHRDELADLALLRGVVKHLSAPVALKVIEHADHSFHVLVRSGTTDDEVRSVMLDDVAAWIAAIKK